MGATLLLDFTVKSIIHDYQVNFIENSHTALKTELEKGDAIIMDKKIKKLYPDLVDGFSEIELILEIEANENQKSYKALAPLISRLIEGGFKKNNKIIAIGGGITQDTSAFIASIMYRGVDWIFFPTTLLAQGDSCIGSKTSINFGEYKNQLGGFYPPHKIYIDAHFLDTLDESDIQSGLGEMSHYFVVSGEKDFVQYKNDFEHVKSNKNILTKMIARSLEIKKSYIEIDEFDQNERQIFNYGHSFGHAIETLTNYKIPHGIAVSFGMDIANFVSMKMDLVNPEIRNEIRDLLERIWEGYSIKNINSHKLCAALSKDKKNVGKQLRLILCKGYGNVFKMPVDNDERLQKWLEEYLINEAV